MNDQPKKRLSPDAEFVLDLLVSAGHITREKAFQARDIALEYAPHTLSMSMFNTSNDALNRVADKGDE